MVQEEGEEEERSEIGKEEEDHSLQYEEQSEWRWRHEARIGSWKEAPLGSTS